MERNGANVWVGSWHYWMPPISVYVRVWERGVNLSWLSSLMWGFQELKIHKNVDWNVDASYRFATIVFLNNSSSLHRQVRDCCECDFPMWHVLLLVLGSVERNDAAATGPSVKPEAKVLSVHSSLCFLLIWTVFHLNFIGNSLHWYRAMLLHEAHGWGGGGGADECACAERSSSSWPWPRGSFLIHNLPHSSYCQGFLRLASKAARIYGFELSNLIDHTVKCITQTGLDFVSPEEHGMCLSFIE